MACGSCLYDQRNSNDESVAQPIPSAMQPLERLRKSSRLAVAKALYRDTLRSYQEQCSATEYWSLPVRPARYTPREH